MPQLEKFHPVNDPLNHQRLKQQQQKHPKIPTLGITLVLMWTPTLPSQKPTVGEEKQGFRGY